MEAPSNQNSAEVSAQFFAEVDRQRKACGRAWQTFLVGFVLLLIAVPLAFVATWWAIMLSLAGALWIIISQVFLTLTFPEVICPDCKKSCWEPNPKCWRKYCCSCGGTNHRIRYFEGGAICKDCGAERSGTKFQILPPTPWKFCTRCRHELPTGNG